MFKKKTSEEKWYRADQAVRAFGKKHKGTLSKRERRKLGRLLDKRASALSDVLGVKVSSVSGK